MMLRKKAISTAEIRKFKPDPELPSLTRRGAQFFDWAAEHFPKQYIPWHWAYQAVTGIRRASLTNKHVELFRASGGRIRTILIDEYGREFTSMKDLGARATVDSEDIAATEAVKKAVRVRGAIKLAARTSGLIKLNELKNPVLKRWISKSYKSAIKEISSTAFMDRLLPPKAEDDDEE